MKALRWFVIVAYLVIATLPLGWMALSSIKSRDDTIRPHPNFVPTPSASDDPKAITFHATTASWAELNTVHAGAQASFWQHLANSLIIGLTSTLCSVALGTACAYGFSRFKIAGAKDWLFFILSTRFMPPLAVVVPVLIMYRALDLPGTHLGLILLYTVFNLSLAVWLMKGFIDEIPKAFEEAALVDGYSRLAAFRKIILPEARTGMAVTAVFSTLR